MATAHPPLCTLLAHHINDEPLACWPLTWGVPLAPGCLHQAEPLTLLDEAGKGYPAQGRALATHPDGSIRQLLLTAEVPLQRAHERRFSLHAQQTPTTCPPASANATMVAGAAGALTLHDGSLILHRPTGNLDVTLVAKGRPAGEAVHDDLACRWLTVEPFATGPIAAAAVFHAELHWRGECLASVRLTAKTYASSPVLECDLEVTNRSTFAAIELTSLELRLRPASSTWSSLQYELRQWGPPASGTLPFEARADRLTISAQGQQRESRLLNYNESWISLGSPDEACVVAVRDFFECYPYGIQADADYLHLQFWPAWHDAHQPIARGAGKTHSFALGWYPAADPVAPRAFGYAAIKQPLTRVVWEDLQVADRFADLMPYLPDEYPRLETTLYDIMYNRNRGYGKQNYGDDYSALYTHQGRGGGQIVWNNLEGDYPYHMFCQFQRTGHYIYWKEFITGIRHWADSDFRDAHEDPLQQGALVVHSAHHNSGTCSPCHNWAEGFREWYFATGDPRPLDILRQMADWLLRVDAADRFSTSPRPYVRGCGWGLIQLAAIYQVIPRPELASLARRIASELLGYCREHDGLPMVLPTGGNHVPADNAFHTATVVMGAERCWRILHDESFRNLAIEAAEVFMDRRTCTPEGIPVYITGPEQDFPMQQAATFAIAALATLHRLTGRLDCLRRGMRMLEYCLDRGMIIDHMRIPGQFISVDGEMVLEVMPLMPNTQLSSYQLRGLLQFLKPAHTAGFLKQLDYRF